MCFCAFGTRRKKKEAVLFGKRRGGVKWGDCGLEIKRRDQKDAVVVLLIYCCGEMTVVSLFWDNVRTFEGPLSWILVGLGFVFFFLSLVRK